MSYPYELLLGHSGYAVQMYTAGADYLRVTVKGDEIGRELAKVYRKIAYATVAHHREGETPFEPWAWLGYYGERCAGVAYGSGSQGAILQVSGPSAQTAMEYNPPWDNVARLDIQYTVWLAEDSPGLGERIADLSSWASKTTRGGRWKTRLQKGYGTGDTAYIGTRGGDRFLRGYDKARESGGQEVYRNAWRFEVETAGDLAPQVWPDKGASAPGQEYWAGYVCQEFRAKGVPLRRPPDGARASVPAYPKEKSGTDRRLAWLRNQVAPSIEKLVADGVSRETVLEALGL